MTPLFAHECLGAYDFMADDRTDSVDIAEAENRRQSRERSKDYTVDEIDLNDPSIEKFPSNRSSVFDSLRKIQSSLPTDQIPVDDSPVFSSIEFRRLSIDSGDDCAVSSTGEASPTSATSSKMREQRLSHSSFGKTRSAVSLTSIAEEPKGPNQSDPRTPASSLLKPGDGFSSLSARSSSDGDDAMTMRGSPFKHKNYQTGEMGSSCASTDTPMLQPSHEIA